MYTQEITVNNEVGLHARPATFFIQKANEFKSGIWVEKGHEERYRRLLERLRTETVFRQPGETVWLCRNCGHLVLGDSAPQVCPVCGHPQGYFERRAENY